MKLSRGLWQAPKRFSGYVCKQLVSFLQFQGTWLHALSYDDVSITSCKEALSSHKSESRTHMNNFLNLVFWHHSSKPSQRETEGLEGISKAM